MGCVPERRVPELVDRQRLAEVFGTQPASGEKHPAAQLQIMIVTELAGEHPQAPTRQVSGNEATPLAQQLAVVTIPPVEVQSSAPPAVDASPSGAAPSRCRPAAPTETLRSHAPPASIVARTAHQSRFEVISRLGAIGERVSGSLGQDAGTAEDGEEVRAAVVATAGLDPQLATYGEQLAAAGQVHFPERQDIENGERVVVATLEKENLHAQQP
jgi:hypothetical protein